VASAGREWSTTNFATKPIKLSDRIERDDVLIVTKLDQIGRNAIDIGTVVKTLSAKGVRVHYLALGGTDLTSPAGRIQNNPTNHHAARDA
jgi:putative DNA-invertase from lambdoid prophage Rac